MIVLITPCHYIQAHLGCPVVPLIDLSWLSHIVMFHRLFLAAPCYDIWDFLGTCVFLSPMSVENPFTNLAFRFFLRSACVNFQQVFSDYREVHASAQWVEREEADGISPADRAQRHWMLGTWRGTGIVGNSTVWRKVSIWQQLYFPPWVLFMVLLYVFRSVCVCVLVGAFCITYTCSLVLQSFDAVTTFEFC